MTVTQSNLRNPSMTTLVVLLVFPHVLCRLCSNTFGPALPFLLSSVCALVWWHLGREYRQALSALPTPPGPTPREILSFAPFTLSHSLVFFLFLFLFLFLLLLPLLLLVFLRFLVYTNCFQAFSKFYSVSHNPFHSYAFYRR